MKKIILVTILAFSFFQSMGQVGPVEKEKLSSLLHKRINDHRQEKGHLALSRNEDLALAATI